MNKIPVILLHFVEDISLPREEHVLTLYGHPEIQTDKAVPTVEKIPVKMLAG